MLDDEVLMETVDSLLLRANHDLSAVVSRLFKHHWNGNLDEQKTIAVAVADFVRRYSGIRAEGEEISYAWNMALGQVMQNPNVQALVESMIKKRSGVQ